MASQPTDTRLNQQGFPVPTDEEMEETIQGAFFMNPNLPAEHVEVSVVGGIATLEGSVDSYWKKLKVEELAANVIGVMDTINKISIVPSRRFADQSLADDVLCTLDRSGLVDVDKIDVKVLDNVVTLSGTVQGWNVLAAVHEMVEQIPGVRDVNNFLVVV